MSYTVLCSIECERPGCGNTATTEGQSEVDGIMHFELTGWGRGGRGGDILCLSCWNTMPRLGQKYGVISKEEN
ncbi:hypothetical protein LCGC14_2749200 [marine sediment metagenome]|uniref:Uncharacterized protein n=1 Tax=marine sediment metagenome TaxID=412755 RepID=A0A0F8Z2F2_9ZZZZ